MIKEKNFLRSTLFYILVYAVIIPMRSNKEYKPEARAGTTDNKAHILHTMKLDYLSCDYMDRYPDRFYDCYRG